MKMDLNLFLVFEAVYAEGNITRASERLRLSQPAVSHALGRLRRSFGDRLFERRGNSMVATPVAESAIGPIREALKHFGTALHGGRGFDPVHEARRFTVGMPVHQEPVFVPGLIGRTAQAFPRLRIDFLRADRRQIERDLATGTLDLAVDILLPLGDEVRRLRIGREALVVLAGGDNAALRSGLDMATYLALDHIQVSSRRSGPSPEDLELGRHGLQRRIRVRCQNHLAAVQVVARSDMLLTIPDRYARSFGPLLATCAHPFPLASGAVESFLYWHAGVDADPANQWLRQQLLDAVDG